jgi:anti-sigma regulatory factor (Ser/Thr protein kinase)
MTWPGRCHPVPLRRTRQEGLCPSGAQAGAFCRLAGPSLGTRRFQPASAGHFRGSGLRAAARVADCRVRRREVRIAGTVLLPCAPASVAVARRRLAAELTAAGVFDGVVGDAVLVVSELLSNAIRHARPLPGSRLLLAWTLDDSAVEVAVSDGGASTRPMTAQATVSSLGGRGLGIVEYLARSWGVRTDDTGLTVWAVVAVPTDPEPRAGTTQHCRGRRAG